MPSLDRVVRAFDLLAPFRREVPPRGDPSWARFDAHIAAQTYEMLRLLSLCLVAVPLVAWPLDFLNPRVGDPSVSFVTWRLGIPAIFGTYYLLLPRFAAVLRDPSWTALPFAGAACTLIAAVLGANNGLDGPWFYNLLFFLIVPIFSPVSFGPRVANITTICGALTIGFFGFNPKNLASPWVAHALQNMAAMAAACVVAGHGMRLVAANAFFQRERIATQGAELAALNAELDARVKAQTEELRALSEHLQVVREIERTRIARELHDDLGQRLAATRYALADATRRLGRGEDVAAKLADVERLLADAAGTTQEIVSAMRPPLLDSLGLHGACAWLTRQMAERASLAWDHEKSGDDRGVEEAVGLAAYRALQEAVTNVVRHARASRVDVTTAVEDGAVTLTVSDDGVGIVATPKPRPPGKGGLGLIGIRERARALGGDVEVGNAKPTGVRLTVRLPRRAAEIDP